MASRSLLLVATLFGLQVAIASVIVPPWQGPDEPRHVLFAHIISKQTRLDLDPEPDYAAELRILQSMARHRWWEHYGRVTPDPMPGMFSQAAGPIGDLYGIPDGPTAYYVATGRLLRVLGIDDVERQYWILRGLSAIAAILTLWCVFLASEAAVGSKGALAVSAALALHPQFVLVAITASPDSVVNLLGSVVWWQTTRLWRGQRTVQALVGIWIAAVAALFTRRLGAPLLLCAAMVTLVVLASHQRTLVARIKRIRWPVAAGIAAILLIAAIVQLDEIRRLLVSMTAPFVSASPSVRPVMPLTAFTQALVDSAWLAAGWLQYTAPIAWRVAAYTLMLGAAAGLAVGWRRLDAPRRRAAMWAALFVAVQTISVYVLYAWTLRMGPQGRYLFPIIAPAFLLYWIGWSALFSARREHLAAAAFVTVWFTLDASGWLLVLVPAYVR